MIKNSFICCLAVAVCLLASSVLQAQGLAGEKLASKVIVDGSTYYLYEVKKGDGFYGIAKKYGVSQKEIHEANPNSIFGLKPGDILYIPVIDGRNSSIQEINKSGEFIYHTIQKGQTLYYLSNKYHVSIDDIKKNNVGVDKGLLTGVIIKIPTSKPDTDMTDAKMYFRYHKVKPKETLYGIARIYQTNVDTVIKYNQALQNGVLSIGSVIRIPGYKTLLATQSNGVSAKKEALEDNAFIYHQIKSGETIYSVSKQYNVAQHDLELSNPQLDPTALPLGFVVRIPKGKVKNQQLVQGSFEDDFVIHVVRRKETIYSIAQKYGVDIADIELANPTSILANIKKGMKINIPTPEYLARKKAEEMMLAEQVNEKQNIIQVDSLHVPCGEYDYYAEKPIVSLALLLPFDMEATHKYNLIKKMEGEEEVEIQREDPIVSPRSRTFIEFYQGVLMAVDSLKKQGANIRVLTFDTAPDTARVKEILAQPELQKVDMIIGPAYASNLKVVSDFSFKHHIKMVYPLSSVNPCLNTNPYLFQVNAADTLLYDKYSEYIVSRQMDARIVVIKSAVPDENENKLASKIKDKLYFKYLPLGIVPDFVEISFSEQNVQGVEALLSSDKLNLVVIPSPGEADVSKIITTLHGVSESTDVKVKLIGFGNWLRFQTINAEEIHELDTEILTPYVLDHNNEEVSRFSAKYRAWYHTEPFAVSPYFIRSGYNSRYSRYGIWGFDVAYYFISAQVKYGKQFEFCLDSFNSSQVQFNFDFKRNVNWGGFYNDGLYVIGFKPSLEITRKPLN